MLFRCLTVVLSLGIAAKAAAGEIPLTGWRSASPAMELTAAEDSLRLTYHHAAHGKPLRLAAEKPLPLPPGLTRLGVWFARMAGDFNLAFEVRDAAGKTHVLPVTTSRMTSDAVYWDAARRHDWSVWNRAETDFLRPPAASELKLALPREQLAAVQARIWPRPLQLTAILITPAAQAGWHAPGAAAEVKKGTGTVVLTDLRFDTADGFQADSCWFFLGRKRQSRDGGPWLFPDDLTTRSGPVRYELELHRGYFGPVAWRRTGTLVLDHSNPMALFRDAVSLPTLPSGRYFLNTRTWRPDGTLEREQLLLPLWVEQRRDLPLPHPAAGAMEWVTAAPRHVFPVTAHQAELELKLSEAAWRDVPPEAVCRIKVLRADRQEAFGRSYRRGERTVCNVPVEPGMDYFATAEIAAGNRVYNRAHLHFGVATPPETAGPIPPGMPDRDRFLTGRTGFTGEYWYGMRARTYPWFADMSPSSLEDFSCWVKMMAAAGVRVIAVGDTWAAHEVLPGVFQWRDIERQIDIIRRHGLEVHFGYTADASSMQRQVIPLWVDYRLSCDQNGQRWADPAFWSPAARGGQARYYQRLATHFRSEPAVTGYRIRTHNLRAPGYGSSRLDYSAPARTAFAAWLKREGKPVTEMGRFLALPEIKTADFSPDLSPAWRNFVDFNSYTIRTSVLDLFRAIRSVDPTRLIIVDQKPFPYAVESLIPELKNGGALKNEDSPNFKTAALRSMCRQAGIPYLEELHNHLPTSRSIADATDFWSSYYADTIFWLIRGRPAIIKDQPVKAAPSSWNQNTERWLLDYLARSRPAWNEWIKAAGYRPEVLVFGSRAQGLLSGRRMGGDFDLGGIDVFSALVCGAQVPCHFADEYSTWVDLNRFRLVIAAGEVMTQAAIDRLAAYSARGGRLVLIGRAGWYCPERPGATEVLRRSLPRTAQVRSLAEPGRMNLPGVQEWASPYAFKPDDVEKLLDWAQVRRPATVLTDAVPGFEVQFRHGSARNVVYLAVMRRWPGWYWNQIEREEVLLRKFGRKSGTANLPGLTNGLWRVEQFHRDARLVGELHAGTGGLTFALPPMLAGEVALFRLTRTDK